MLFLHSLRKMHTEEAQRSAPLSLLIEKEEAAITLEVSHCQHRSFEPRNYFWTLWHKNLHCRSFQFWSWSRVPRNNFEECEEENPGAGAATSTSAGSHRHGKNLSALTFPWDIDSRQRHGQKPFSFNTLKLEQKDTLSQ